MNEEKGDAKLEELIMKNSFVDTELLNELRQKGYAVNIHFGIGDNSDKAIIKNKKISLFYGYNKPERVYYVSLRNGEEKFADDISVLIDQGYKIDISDDKLKTIFTKGNDKYILKKEKDGGCVFSYSSNRSKVISRLRGFADKYKEA